MKLLKHSPETDWACLQIFLSAKLKKHKLTLKMAEIYTGSPVFYVTIGMVREQDSASHMTFVTGNIYLFFCLNLGTETVSSSGKAIVTCYFANVRFFKIMFCTYYRRGKFGSMVTISNVRPPYITGYLHVPNTGILGTY